jgi:Flp pilus assembly protein TadG
MNKLLKGIMFGAIAGLVDITPMILMKLPLSASLSAFSLWVVAGLLIASSDLKINKVARGIIIALLVFLPSAFIIAQNGLVVVFFPLVMTMVLGGLLGYFAS